MTGKELRPTRVVVTLDRERELRYDMNALSELEAKFGGLQGIFEIETSLANIRFLLWAGLIHEDDALTEKQVGKLADTTRLKEYSEAVSCSLERALPLPDPNAEAPQGTSRSS